MAGDIRAVVMPKWGLAMTEGTVTAWLLPEGAAVRAGDEILEIETSKITNVHESPASGVLRRHVVAAGETVPVGTVLAVLADAEVADATIDTFVAEARAALATQSVAPPQPQTIEAGGLVWRYLRMGPDGNTPLLLLHGFGGDLDNWQFNQPLLAEDRAVYAIDLPGHGGSAKAVPAGDVAGLAAAVQTAMAALGITRAHLVGHSLGGAIALQLALGAPAAVASVTLICAAGLGMEIDGAYIDAFIAADRRKEMKAAVEMLFADPSLVSRDMVEALVRYKRLDGVSAALRGIAAGCFPGGRQAAVLAGSLAALVPPVQAIWGEGDRIIPARHAQMVPRRQVLAGAGHMVHLEQAAEVNRLIGNFVSITD